MEDENKQLDNSMTDEEANTTSSFKSSVKNAAGNIGSNLLNNKYQSIKNKNKPDSTGNTKNNIKLNGINNPLNGLKKQGLNTLLNQVSNIHPALKTLNTLNNIRKGISGIKNNGISASVTGASKKDDNSTDTSETTTNTSSSVDNSQIDTTGSVSSKKNGGFLGSIRFIGIMPSPIKIAFMVGGPIGVLIVFLLPIILVIGFFSGFLGMDEVTANNGSSNGGNIDYGDYELTSDGDQILHESLDSFLASQGTSLEEFNNLIASNVENSGYGTDAGVVAAAVTLIAELGNNYDVKIPYFWGGGHGQMITGAEGNWGSNQCRASANGRIYDYCGLDCSGFVAWAIWNGGFNIAARVTGQFQDLPGAERVSLSSSSAVLAPGDLLESNSHIVLVIGIDEETNEYICAEASGYTTGVLFTRRPFSRSGYWGVRMSGFYERQVRS